MSVCVSAYVCFWFFLSNSTTLAVNNKQSKLKIHPIYFLRPPIFTLNLCRCVSDFLLTFPTPVFTYLRVSEKNRKREKKNQFTVVACVCLKLFHCDAPHFSLNLFFESSIVACVWDAKRSLSRM